MAPWFGVGVRLSVSMPTPRWALAGPPFLRIPVLVKLLEERFDARYPAIRPLLLRGRRSPGDAVPTHPHRTRDAYRRPLSFAGLRTLARLRRDSGLLYTNGACLIHLHVLPWRP
jgi:hypothetical protein